MANTQADGRHAPSLVTIGTYLKLFLSDEGVCIIAMHKLVPFARRLSNLT